VWAKAVRPPRVIIFENVEEFEDWGPLGPDNRPDPSARGLTFRIWKGKLEALGYKVEHRELVAAKFGAPTIRKRLYLIARCDGQPIVWPKEADGHALTWRRVAADCIDWSLPTYSIFLTAEEAKQLQRAPAARREHDAARLSRLREVRDAQPAAVHRRRRWSHGAVTRAPAHAPDADHHRQGRRGDLCTPFITEHANATNPRSWRADEPLRTACAQVKGGHFALVAPFMVPRYGEDPNPARRGGMGQAPRSRSVELPMPTIVPSQNGAQLVAAFLAKHNGGHEATGQGLLDGVHTIVARENKALVTSSLVKFKGTCQHGQQLRLPLATVQAQGLHYAETRAYLVKYYGSERDGQRLDDPMGTATGLDRFGPQVRMVGNSVCPPVAAALARAQFEDQVIEVAA
jgi:DNA (cytosine-5)-methyltransferase 1